MATLPTPRLIVLAERCYRLLLFTYPAEFRRTYAWEMSQTFRDGCSDIQHAEGTWGLARFCALTLTDLATTSCKEHFRALLARLKRLFDMQAPLEPAFLTAPLRLQIAQQTDVGCKRRINEDNLLTVLPEDPHILKEKGALFVVADGMGGHKHGDRASQLAVTTVREAYYQAESVNNATSLSQAIQQAHLRIYNENMTQSKISGGKDHMGTTCIAAVLQEKMLTVANVGDSRAYIIHQGQIRQVSQDHSLVAQMVRAGIITAKQASSHAQRNVIYRSLGSTQTEVEVDVFEEAVAEGDALILCTDGLCGLVNDDEMLHIVEKYQPEEGVRQLVARARAAGGPDNITAVVVRVAA